MFEFRPAKPYSSPSSGLRRLWCGWTMGKLLEMRLVPVVVALVCILNASGARSQADPGIFLNIDCGSPDNSTDVLGLRWYADTSYISTGSSLHLPASQTLPLSQQNTLRFFNDTRFPKYCYKLPVTSNATYMLKAVFAYGGFDGGSSSPTFKMAIDGLVVANVTGSLDHEFRCETTYVAKGNITYLCLLREKNKGDPYISSISLRRVNAYPAMYESHLSKGFVANTRKRHNFGAYTTVRYPDDIYDRIWTPVDATVTDVLPFAVIFYRLDTSRPLLYAAGNPAYAEVPVKVLQTALASSYGFTLSLALRYGATGFLILHFAELNPTVDATSRVFTVKSSSVTGGTEVNPYKDSLATGGDAIGLEFDNIRFTSPSHETVYFTPHLSSLYGPLVNAAEFFEYLEGTLGSKTLDVDALAIDDIKSSLGLGEWTGDPCIPVPHTWVNCSTADPPTIELVDLSNFNLAGTIPASFAKLQTLTTLNLSRNNLKGELPDLSALTNLRILDLRGNNLTGPLPEWLGNLKFLTELYVQDNDFTGAIPLALNRTGLTFEYQPGNTLVWSQGKNSDNIWVIVGPVIGGAVAVIAAAFFITCCCCVRRRRRSGTNVSTTSATSAAKAPAPAPAVALVIDRAPNAGDAKSFSVAELARATENFNREIGKGGFGSVYYGKLPNGLEVAVKVLGNAIDNQKSKQGATEFFNEVDVLSRVHHRNLVSLLGFCNETGNQMLVYEYLPQGSLRDRLNASAQLEVLDFKARLNVALNAAQGLEHLHTGCNPGIVHRDVKSSNILLTNTKEAAKVADFGLSSLFPEEEGSVTVVKGSRGYIDPEYESTHFLTSKSDVYSFGVVLLELLTGRVPVPSTSEPQSNLAWTLCDWVRKTLQSEGTADNIVDPSLKSSHPDQEAVWKLTDLAMMCVEPKSIHRPSMAEVVHGLRSALTMEEAKTGAAYTHQHQERHHDHDQQKQPHTSGSSDYDSGVFNTSLPSWPGAR